MRSLGSQRSVETIYSCDINPKESMVEYGIKNDLSKRLKEHRLKKTKSGQLLKDFFVLHTEEFPDYKKARIREKFLKSGQGRKWLDTLELKSESARGG